MNNLHVKTAFQLPHDLYGSAEDGGGEMAAALMAPPNITMKIADQNGHDISTAKVSVIHTITRACELL